MCVCVCVCDVSCEIVMGDRSGTRKASWYFNFQVVLGRIKVEVESWEEVFNLSASFLFKFLLYLKKMEKHNCSVLYLNFWFDFCYMTHHYLLLQDQIYCFFHVSVILEVFLVASLQIIFMKIAS